ASHATGDPVTVWTTPTPEGAVRESRLAVQALRRLGFRATLRELTGTTYFTYTNDSRNQAQVIDGGWGADYPSANDFISKLTCSYFVPGDPGATSDASDFCAPNFDRHVRHAADLQAVNPARASSLWGRLDRLLTNRAIWLPTVTPNETDIVSARVG